MKSRKDRVEGWKGLVAEMAYYLLDAEKNPVKVESGEWFRKTGSIGPTRVCLSPIKEWVISTVFWGIDLSGTGTDLFETNVFGGKFDDHCERCSTWAEAEEQHRRVVGMVERGTVDGTDGT